MEADIVLTEEERLYIIRRREAVKAFLAFCQRPIPLNGADIERDNELQNRLEAELTHKWGVNV